MGRRFFMKSYTDFAIKAKSLKSARWNNNGWANKQGIFETPQGKWIARVKCVERGFVTLSQHDKKEDAENAYSKFNEKFIDECF